MQSGQASITESSVGVMYTDTAELTETQAGLIVARQVHGTPIKTTVLLAGEVEGPVETYFDTPRALLAGLTADATVGLVLFIGNLVSRWKR